MVGNTFSWFHSQISLVFLDFLKCSATRIDRETSLCSLHDIIKVLCILILSRRQGRSQEFLMGEFWGQNWPKKGRGGKRGFATQCYYPSHGGWGIKHTNPPLGYASAA
jgi:hypothetical protein